MKTTTKPRKSYMLAGVGIGSAYLLSKKENRDKLMTMAQGLMDKFGGSFKQTKGAPIMDKVGNPHPYDTADNKMVEEGAQYSVDYYNEKQSN